MSEQHQLSSSPDVGNPVLSSTAISSPSPQSVTYNKYGEVVDLSNYKGSSSLYQETAKWKYKDEESGCYATATLCDKTSSGQLFKEKGSGRVGYKDEVKYTTVFKIGNKTGYTEYQYQEKIRKVNFGKDNKIKK